jgi:hypothetical protein
MTISRRATLISVVPVALAVAAGAALWLNHLASEPGTIALGYVVTTAICLGAVIYLIGTVLGYGLFALRLRWAGWIVMTLGFVVPSTFSLALPIVLFLAVTLRPLPPRPPSEQPSRDVVIPR